MICRTIADVAVASRIAARSTSDMPLTASRMLSALDVFGVALGAATRGTESSAVDFAVVRHLNNEHDKQGVSYFVDNTVVADAYSIVVFRSRLRHSRAGGNPETQGG